MALRGNLNDFTLPDVFQLIALSKKTGVLRMRRADGPQGNVWFRDGEVFFAESNWHRERLGERLVTAQKITPSALVRALQLRAEEPDNGRRLGRILVDEGYITESVLEAFVRDQVLEPIFDLMRWEEGEFDFEMTVKTPEEDIGLAVSIENIVMEGARRLEEWERIKKKIPSMDLVFKMATAPGEGSFEISLKPVEWNLLLLIDGTRTVADLARSAHWTEFDSARVLYGLYSAGLLEVASDDEVARLRAERAARDVAATRSAVGFEAPAPTIAAEQVGATAEISETTHPVAASTTPEAPEIVESAAEPEYAAAVSAEAPAVAVPIVQEPARFVETRIPRQVSAVEAGVPSVESQATVVEPASVQEPRGVEEARTEEAPEEPASGMWPEAGPEVLKETISYVDEQEVVIETDLLASWGEPSEPRTLEPPSPASRASETVPAALEAQLAALGLDETAAGRGEAATEIVETSAGGQQIEVPIAEASEAAAEALAGGDVGIEESAPTPGEHVGRAPLTESPVTEPGTTPSEAAAQAEVPALEAAEPAPETAEPSLESAGPESSAEPEPTAGPPAPLFDARSDLGLASVIAEEITALTGVERTSRPAAATTVPDVAPEVPRRDASIDRDTLLDIIEGIKRL